MPKNHESQIQDRSNTKPGSLWLFSAISLFGICISGASAQQMIIAAEGQLAESTYAHLSNMSRGALTFKTEEIVAGPLSEVAGQKLSSIVYTPTFVVEYDTNFQNITDPRLVTPGKAHTFSLMQTPSALSKEGLDVEKGTYRLLDITMTLNGRIFNHSAIEFCFAEQNYCTVYDPVLLYLESDVRNEQTLRAEGAFAVSIEYGEEPATIIKHHTSPKCGLASNTSATSVTYRNPAYNVLRGSTTWGGIRVYLGETQLTISCNNSCKPAVADRVTFSSTRGVGIAPWHGACALLPEKANFWNGGKSVTTTLATGCAVRSSGTASLKYKYTGSGASLNFAIDVSSGSVMTNGDRRTETCDFFATH